MGGVARAKTRNVVNGRAVIVKTRRSNRAISHKREQMGAEKAANGADTASGVGYKPHCATCDKMYVRT